VKLPTHYQVGDEPPKLKGYAFITFEKADDARDCLRSGVKLGNVELQISIARDQTRSTPMPRSAPYPSRSRPPYDREHSPSSRPLAADSFNGHDGGSMVPPPPQLQHRIPPPPPPQPYQSSSHTGYQPSRQNYGNGGGSTYVPHYNRGPPQQRESYSSSSERYNNDRYSSSSSGSGRSYDHQSGGRRVYYDSSDRYNNRPQPQQYDNRQFGPSDVPRGGGYRNYRGGYQSNRGGYNPYPRNQYYDDRRRYDNPDSHSSRRDYDDRSGYNDQHRGRNEYNDQHRSSHRSPPPPQREERIISDHKVHDGDRDISKQHTETTSTAMNGQQQQQYQPRHSQQQQSAGLQHATEEEGDWAL
jgi:hypothetical protein